ncbi:MAG: RNB domain-containing ribonuclease [Chlamydiales bacterium]
MQLPDNVDLTSLAKQAMRERGLLPEFPARVIDEVSHLKEAARPTEHTVLDLRSQLFFSIDNDDSRDLDQLTYAESLSDGLYKIYVAIADVDALVKTGSAIDQYAQTNTVSVYTPSKIFTMLPEKLSTNLTSLNEDQDRLAIVIEVTVAADGSVGDNNSLYQAQVRNCAKLAYNGLAAWLNGNSPPPSPRISSIAGLQEQIQLQDQIAQLLKKYRQEQGSLTLETIEAHPIVKNSQVVEVTALETNRARFLIEEFMIAANTATSRFLRTHQQASLRRVVRIPKRWDRVVEIAQERGEKLPDEPDAKALNLFLIKQQASDPVRFPDLSLTIIKLLGRGEYVVEYPGQAPIGHFNLAVKDYTHSTAPNRRFPDLITQRLVKSLIENKNAPYTVQELEDLAARCTEKSADADKVERKMRKCATILLLFSKLNQTFKGIVTGSSFKGTWVRIFDPPTEGKLVKGYEHLDVGDQIIVKLVHLDIEKGFIDFERAQLKQ